MSCLVTARIAFLILRQTVLPTPIGRMPWHLSRAVSKWYIAHRWYIAFLATRARLLHRSVEALWKEVHRRRHPVASTPEGPADPLVRRVAERMVVPSIESKITGRMTGLGVVGGKTASRCAGWPGGCFFISSSLTVTCDWFSLVSIGYRGKEFSFLAIGNDFEGSTVLSLL